MKNMRNSQIAAYMNLKDVDKKLTMEYDIYR